ncbi:hypothetical protein [Streptomyces sp. NPDC051572]|uniref:hypothetical protein n=1 Tax=unclassified Streptomyces TaxID=2593676 RepID=UPI00344E26EC
MTTSAPAPWPYDDLGDFVLDARESATCAVVSVRAAGITVCDDGVFTVHGAGADLNVNGRGMKGQFVRQPVTDDCELTVRPVSRTGARAGMQTQLMLRTTVAGASAFTGTVTVQLPALLRLKRTGTAFAAAVSTDDGATWTTIASGAISGLGDAPHHVGLLVCSRDLLTRCASQFDEVSITPT